MKTHGIHCPANTLFFYLQNLFPIICFFDWLINHNGPYVQWMVYALYLFAIFGAKNSKIGRVCNHSKHRACLDKYFWGKSNFFNASGFLLFSFYFYLLDLHWNMHRKIFNYKSNIHLVICKQVTFIRCVNPGYFWLSWTSILFLIKSDINLLKYCWDLRFQFKL